MFSPSSDLVLRFKFIDDRVGIAIVVGVSNLKEEFSFRHGCPVSALISENDGPDGALTSRKRNMVKLSNFSPGSVFRVEERSRRAAGRPSRRHQSEALAFNLKVLLKVSISAALYSLLHSWAVIRDYGIRPPQANIMFGLHQA